MADNSMDFLFNCKLKYSCNWWEIATIPEGYSFSPFVELKIGNEVLTVGNKSRPSGNNTAVIKSLNYGASDGCGATIEIEDEEGGTFAESFNRLNKSLAGMAQDTFRYELDFGWIIEGSCGGEFNTRKLSVSNATSFSSKIYLLPNTMKVTYEGNKIKYSLEATDLMARVGEARVECNTGTEDKKVPLKQAIRDLCGSKEPAPKCKVKFLSSDGKSDFSFKASDNGFNGPKSVWTTNQQNKLAIIRRWIDPYKTSNDKGIVIHWEGGRPESEEFAGTIIIQEDPNPDFCSKNFDPCSSNISTLGIPGTFIVNGGKKSAVISFNPTVSWALTNLGKSGGAQSSVDGGGAKQEGVKGCKDNRDKGGSSTYTPDGQSQLHNRSTEEITDKSSDASTAHQNANLFREIYSPIEAELKIFGNPALVFPQLLIGKSISLVVINPFHLRPNSNSNCPDWLAQPTCNSVFSNKHWMIRGVNHQIDKGSYVTILTVFLPAPGIHFNPDVELGGPNSGGPKLDIKTQPDAQKC